MNLGPERHPDVQAGQRAHADEHVVLGARPAVHLAQRPGDLLRPVRRVAVPRQVHQAGHEAAVVVPPLEEPHLAPVLQLEDPGRDGEQLVGVDLEELVARVGLQDLAQRPAAVALRCEPGPIEHLGGLLPQQRDVEHAVAVDVGVVEPEEAALADNPAVAIEPLDADVGQVVGPQDRAAAVGRGQHEHGGREHHPPRPGRELGHPVRVLGAPAVPEEAEPGAGHGRDHLVLPAAGRVKSYSR